MLSSPTANMVLAIQNQVKLITEMTEIEKSILTQKSRVHWLKEVDQNTRYFYIVVKSKISQ